MRDEGGGRERVREGGRGKGRGEIGIWKRDR